jgi:hypothetical protein
MMDGLDLSKPSNKEKASLIDNSPAALALLFLKKKEAPLTQYQVNGNGREKRGLRK